MVSLDRCGRGVGGLAEWGQSLAGMFTCSIVHIQNQVPAERRTEVIGNLGSSGFLGMIVGSLLGVKTVLNEFVAYLHLAQMLQEGQELSARAVVIATYALCGFANFSSIAIQIGGIGPLAPSRVSELAQLGMRAVLAGTLANLMTATIAGVLAG